jgi:hypothetical protein
MVSPMLLDTAFAASLGHRRPLAGWRRAAFFLGISLAPLGLISCAATAGGDPPPPVAAPPAATVTVSAPATQVAAGGTVQFTANVLNASNPAVTWEVNSIPSGNLTVGTVTPQGLYLGPANPPKPPQVTVSAVLAADAAISGSAPITVVAAVPTFGVLSWRNDTMLSGVDSQETILTPTSIHNSAQTVFGKVSACPVDGEIYAQPLYDPQVSLVAAGLHNVVFVATENDSVFAFDADASPCETLWKTSFLNPALGVATVPACLMMDGACVDGGVSNDVGTNDITPEIGITGTPVINPANGILYVVSKTKESTVNGPIYVQRLHALDITTGNEEPFSPVVIQALITGNGAGNNGQDQVPFDPLHENQSAALALSGTNVYVAFGSHGDVEPFHGWLLAYNVNTLAQVAVFNTTPNSSPSEGGISESGAAPSIDASGTIFGVTGQGVFDANNANAPNTEYAQTLLRLSVNSTAGSFTVVDRFTPFNQSLLTADGENLGSSGALLLPNQSSGPAHLAVIGGVPGVLYLVNRDNLGGYTLGGPDKVLGKLNLNGAIYSTPVFWQGSLYTSATGQNLSAYPLSNGVLASVPSALSPETFTFPAPSPVISANGASNGILWVVDASGWGADFAAATPAILRAYQATNLGDEIYNSSVNSADAAGLAVKFAVPTVANGKVYVGTQGELSVYGLLN